MLNDSYVANVGDFTAGRVNNPYKDLAAGPHSLTLKAWDTYNNSAERTIEFVVANNEKLALDHVLNYPNPFAHHTTFFFDHNQAGSRARQPRRAGADFHGGRPPGAHPEQHRWYPPPRATSAA